MGLPRIRRAIPSVVTVPTLLGVGALLLVWRGEGGWAALSLATGYTAVALLAATLAVTPLHRLRRRRSAPAHTPLRRSLGVHAGVLAIVHMAVSFPVHLGGNVLRFFVPESGDVVSVRFLASNWLGLVAVVLIGVLLVTSTDGSLRRLGVRRWKRLHAVVFLAAGASVLHTLGYQWLRDASLALIVGLIGLVVASAALRRAASRARSRGG